MSTEPERQPPERDRRDDDDTAPQPADGGEAPSMDEADRANGEPGAQEQQQ
jgi:hypothetical protein